MYENGDVAGSAYDPSAYARGLVTSEEGGTGLAREKHPVASLRVFSGPDAADWLLYGGVQGGAQGKGWVEVYYRGIVRQDKKHVIGDWVLRIEGEGLESLAHQLGKQVRTMLKVGKEENYEVKTISLEPLKLVEQED